ncbi:MAG: hypothetical protein ACOYN4_14900 [Bacteroidales bacterium]
MELLIHRLFFIGIRELKVRQIDYDIIFGWLFIPIMAISSVINLFFKGQMEYAIISFSVGDKILPWLFLAIFSASTVAALFCFHIRHHAG